MTLTRTTESVLQSRGVFRTDKHPSVCSFISVEFQTFRVHLPERKTPRDQRCVYGTSRRLLTQTRLSVNDSGHEHKHAHAETGKRKSRNTRSLLAFPFQHSKLALNVKYWGHFAIQMNKNSCRRNESSLVAMAINCIIAHAVVIGSRL